MEEFASGLGKWKRSGRDWKLLEDLRRAPEEAVNEAIDARENPPLDEWDQELADIFDGLGDDPLQQVQRVPSKFQVHQLHYPPWQQVQKAAIHAHWSHIRTNHPQSLCATLRPCCLQLTMAIYGWKTILAGMAPL
eukprot:492091-Amphidinium_carterae.1